MAYPTSDGANPDLYQQARFSLEIAGGIKRRTQSLRDDAAAGDVTAERLLTYHQDLEIDRSEINTIVNITGIQRVFREIIDVPGFNLSTEYTDLETDINSVLDEIETLIPDNGVPDNFLLTRNFSGRALVSRTFNTTETAALRTDLDALIAQID